MGGHVGLADQRRPPSLSLPSIDFVFLDSSGRLVFMELKVAVNTPKQAWSVLCQVTHRACLLAESASQANLNAAFSACMSGQHGRAPDVLDVPLNVQEAFHQRFNTNLSTSWLPARRGAPCGLFAD